MAKEIISEKENRNFNIKTFIDSFDGSHQMGISTNGSNWDCNQINEENAKIIIECLIEYIEKTFKPGTYKEKEHEVVKLLKIKNKMINFTNEIFKQLHEFENKGK